MQFHEGEVAVQERLGVRAMAERVGNSIGTRMPAVAQAWLRAQHLAAATTVAPDGSVWVSLLSGEAGFLEASDETTLQVRTALVDDVLQANLAANSAIGLIVLEPSARKRMRVNGTAQLEHGELTIRAQQVYANCPKYIQARHVVETEQETATIAQTGTALAEAQRQLIQSADTFFIGSYSDGNADASHRGGNPGFVQVVSETLVTWLDYPGNTMFNTFGNLYNNSQCGLLFVDWNRGQTLQLSGHAFLEHDGSQTSVRFQLHQWRETVNGSSLRWQLDEYSPFNPRV